MVEIRSAVTADIPAIRSLLVRTWHHTYDTIYGAEKVTEITDRWHSIDNLMRQLSLPLSAFLVVDEKGQIVATAKASGLANGVITIDRLYVDPSAQRVGHGGRLLDAVLAAFPLATQAKLEVEPQNEGAVSFYLKHDFSVAGATSDCGGGNSGIAANRMVKALRSGSAKDAIAVMLRPVRDSDAQDLIGLITLCFAEYPGCFFDPHDDMPDIVRPAQSWLATEGQFLAVEDGNGRVCACVGVDFPASDRAELHRLYVRPDMRGRGLAKELTRRMEEVARERGATRMTLWSDTRFTKAHALYEGLGYQRSATTRSLGDISKSREFFFERML